MTDRKSKALSRLKKKILRSKILLLLQDHLKNTCDKHESSEQRMQKYETPKEAKCLKLYTPRKHDDDVLLPDIDEILYTNLKSDELKQVAEDLNFFIPNAELKRKVTLFNSEFKANENKEGNVRSNSLNVNKLLEIKSQRDQYFSPTLVKKRFKESPVIQSTMSLRNEEDKKRMQTQLLKAIQRKHSENCFKLLTHIQTKLTNSETSRFKKRNEISEQIQSANLVENIYNVVPPDEHSARAKDTLDAFIKKIEDELPYSAPKVRGGEMKIRLKEWQSKRLFNGFKTSKNNKVKPLGNIIIRAKQGRVYAYQ